MDHVTLRIPKHAVVIVLLVAIAAAVGAIGFWLGRDSAAVPQPAAAQPVDEAQDARAARRNAERAERRIYARGVAEGRRRGAAQATRRGAEAALGGAQFDLRAGVYYVARFSRGGGGVPLELDRAVEFEAGRSYLLCGSYELCYR